mmetsp:Transcript_83306/g.258679  ORF Transcript_83306/g.258679 Transcript_83306/m.258679 type:complete len:367 (-) Transcript_83306:59-1159(-)
MVEGRRALDDVVRRRRPGDGGRAREAESAVRALGGWGEARAVVAHKEGGEDKGRGEELLQAGAPGPRPAPDVVDGAAEEQVGGPHVGRAVPLAEVAEGELGVAQVAPELEGVPPGHHEGPAVEENRMEPPQGDRGVKVPAPEEAAPEGATPARALARAGKEPSVKMHASEGVHERPAEHQQRHGHRVPTAVLGLAHQQQHRRRAQEPEVQGLQGRVFESAAVEARRRVGTREEPSHDEGAEERPHEVRPHECAGVAGTEDLEVPRAELLHPLHRPVDGGLAPRRSAQAAMPRSPEACEQCHEGVQEPAPRQPPDVPRLAVRSAEEPRQVDRKEEAHGQQHHHDGPQEHEGGQEGGETHRRQRRGAQ